LRMRIGIGIFLITGIPDFLRHKQAESGCKAFMLTRHTFASDHDGRRLRFDPVTLLGGIEKLPMPEYVMDDCR
jgi:hypothetical protein